MDQASKCGKFVKENVAKSPSWAKAMSFGEKLLPTSENFSESLLSTNLRKVS